MHLSWRDRVVTVGEFRRLIFFKARLRCVCIPDPVGKKGKWLSLTLHLQEVTSRTEPELRLLVACTSLCLLLSDLTLTSAHLSHWF